MSLASVNPSIHPAIEVGQQFEACPRKVHSPEGIEWDYPHGKGIVTVEAVTEAGESTEFGTRSEEAVWYRFEDSDKVQDLEPHYFLLSFSRI